MVKILEGAAAKITVPNGKIEIQVFDDALPGFGIRKFANGRASYFVKYQIGRQQRKISLGPVVPGVAGEMRRKASDILAKARLGQDVVAEKRAAVRKVEHVVGNVIKAYLTARRSEVGPRHYVEIERYLLRYWEPLHGMALEDVKRRDVVLRVDVIAEERGRVTADHARDALGGFFAWCVSKCYLEANPATNITRKVSDGRRSHVLTEAELVDVWRAAGDDEYGAIVRLLILTGQRRAEIGDLAWSEINRDDQQIELPKERTKNGLPHIVPLSREALAIINAVPARHGRDLVFGESAGRGFQGWSMAKIRLDERIAAAREKAGKKPMAPWVLHDIRRSVITHLNERGIAPPHVIEAIANHISGAKAGVAGVYNRANYAAEKCAALEKWGRHVARLVKVTSNKIHT